MLALGLCIALFLYFTVLGYATVSLLGAGRAPLRNLLIAPVVGVVVNVLPVFTINRLGLPVMKFGAASAAVLLLAAVGALVWLWRRDRPRVAVPWRPALLLAAVPLFSLYMTARPMSRYGFEWLSFCNDDMANYCMAADRFYRGGYFDVPEADHVMKGTYYPDEYYFLYIPLAVRPGCELTLAWVLSVTGLNAHEAFMPTIVVFHLAALWAACSLLLRVDRAWSKKRPAPEPTPVPEGEPAVGAVASAGVGPGGGAAPAPADAVPGDDGAVAAFVCGIVLAQSALLTLGTLYQLIAQTIGLGLLATLAALVLRPFHGVPWRRTVLHGVLVGVVGSGLLIFYPEVTPFLGVSLVLYTALGLARRRLAVRPLLVILGVSVLVALVLLRIYALWSVQFLYIQVSGVPSQWGDPQTTLFPFFMIPKGLADFWGILGIAQTALEPRLSTAIAAGGVLLLLAFLAAAWLAWRGRPEATVALVMFLVGISLFRGRAGFGLYKLAMYMQPFVLGALVAACFALVRRRAVRADVAFGACALVVAAYLFASDGWAARSAAT